MAPGELSVPPDARRLHPLSPVIGLVPALRPFGLPALFLLVTGSRLVLAALVLLAGGAALGTAVSYRWTRYLLTEEELVVWSGVLRRSTRVVSPRRVQKVEIVRRLRHRATDLAAVEIELVGVGDERSKVTLDALTVAEATRVRDTLERGRRGAPPGGGLAPAEGPVSALPPPPPPPPAVLLRIGTGLLALGGISGAPVLLVPVLAAGAVSEFRDLLDGPLDEVEGVRLAAAAVALLFAVGLVLWVVVAAGIMVLRFHGYELARSGDDVVVRRGLVETRTSVIPLRRVHLVDVSASILRRRLGLASVDVRTASPGDRGGGSLGVTVPVARRDDVDRLVPLLLGRAEVPADLVPHPSGALRRATVRRTLVCVPVSLLLAAPVLGELRPGPLGSVAGLGAASLLGAAAARWAAVAWHRRLGHCAADGLLVAAEGVFLHHVRHAPLDRIQSVAVAQQPFQRRLGVCDLVAHLAGPTPDVRLRDVSAAQAAAVASLVRGLEAVRLGPPGERTEGRPPVAPAGAIGGGGRESNPPDGDHPSHPL